MDQDLYRILGVGRTAHHDEIRGAYRKLAKEYHPDRNPGDKAAEEKFKQISAAFDILGDPEKRKKYDNGEIDASGRETPGGFYSDSRGGRGRGSENFGDFSDIFGDVFGRTSAGGFNMRGMDYRYHLEIDFLEAVNGGTHQVTLPEGQTLDIRIPPGARDGQTLRLRGKGQVCGTGERNSIAEVIELDDPVLTRREEKDVIPAIAVEIAHGHIDHRERRPDEAERHEDVARPVGAHADARPAAEQDRHPRRDGERQEKTVWFRVTAWERDAELVSQYLTKGRQVLIVGEVEEARPFTDRDGNQRASLEVTARTIRFVGGRGDGTGGTDTFQREPARAQGNGSS